MKKNLKLRAAMAAKGVTQEELAQALGITRAALSYKMSGINEFKQSEIKRAAEYLDTIVDIFFDEMEV